MKSISQRAMCIIAGVLGVLICGCISHERTVYEEAPRSRVEFENDRAARVFYETLSKAPPRRHAESKTEIAIPIVFDHKHRVVPGQNVVSMMRSHCAIRIRTGRSPNSKRKCSRIAALSDSQAASGPGSAFRQGHAPASSSPGSGGTSRTLSIMRSNLFQEPRLARSAMLSLFRQAEI